MERNSIEIKNIDINKNRISYSYQVFGEWKAAFKQDEDFFVEYGCDISSVPKGIAVVPLLANILPIAWIFDAEIIVPICDKSFYDSVSDIKKGYCEMFPMVDFKGKLSPKELQNNTFDSTKKTAAFFSGGVDAFNTLVCHADEHPLLLTLWGADIKTNDLTGWEKVKGHLKDTAAKFGDDFITIKSSFRCFINERYLTQKVADSGENWWHGFQHGIGIIAHAAPIAYLQSISTIYFASSFTAADKGLVKCASDPTIDNYIRFGNTHVIHDGYEFTRQMKVHNIVEYSLKTGVKIHVRVCWESDGGSNCCSCEKCWRTILAFYAEKQNPRDYGFEYSDTQLLKLAIKMRYGGDRMFGLLRYRTIQKTMQSNYSKAELPIQIRWFYDVDFNSIGKVPLWYKAIKIAGILFADINKFVHLQGATKKQYIHKDVL